MSKLNIDTKSIIQLLGDSDTDFLVPDYQRPYAWTESECKTLWDDLWEFAIPGDNSEDFDEKSEYFLGPIVSYKNEDNKNEIIDGQQRLTTIMLLLRAFHVRLKDNPDRDIQKIKDSIESCIWKTDQYGNPYWEQLKIDSKVATDNDREQFLEILRTGVVSDDMTSNYAKNYAFFTDMINSVINRYFSAIKPLSNRILKNCILLPIEADSQDSALRIFSTLNDRGLPLSDADIFKSQFYKHYSAQNKKDEFIERWRNLDTLCEKIFHPIYGTPMDDLFTRYMYYERALMDNKSSTTEALRKFYEKNNYELLRKEGVFENLENLAAFWDDISNQDTGKFSDRVLRRLFVLNYAPNGMWTYLVSVFYMHNKDENGLLEDEAFHQFLNKITAFIWTYAFTNPGLNSLRTPVYSELVNIVKGIPVTFEGFKFDLNRVETAIRNFMFNNSRTITKSMLTWWAYQDNDQELLEIYTPLEIEHIYAKRRNDLEPLSSEYMLQCLGNKSLLEKRVNIRASDYRFSDKCKFYKGFTKGDKEKEGTKIKELMKLSENNDFTEKDIIERNDKIILSFLQFIKDNDLEKH